MFASVDRKLPLGLFASAQILSKLKGLALDTKAELERQDAALEDITAAVEHVTLTTDKHSQRMKRLT